MYITASQHLTKLSYDGFTQAEVSRFEKDLQRILDNLTEFEERTPSSRVD